MERHHDDPHASPTAYVVAVLAIVFIGAVIALEGYFGRVASEEEAEKVVNRSSEELAQVRAEQEQLISEYQWRDQEAGVVAIPVERAMDLVAAELTKSGGVVDSR